MSRIAPTFPATQNTSTAIAALNTPNSISVTTQTGFSQGDLVYYNNGDYKTPSNLTAPSSITFNYPQPQLVMSGGVGGVATPVFSTTDYYTSDAYGGSQNQAMAVLTNGNIVQVWRSYSNNYPMFRIVNSSGTIVVAATAISTSATYQNTYLNVAVCALTGGGFAVMFLNSSNNPSFAVYTNTGSVTTAATSDTISGYTGSVGAPIQMTPLANGGWATAYSTSSGYLFYKIYTATGGTTVNWTNVWAQGAQTYGYGIASRSDSSICIVGYYGAGGYNAYAVYSATGGTIVSAPTSLGASYSTNYIDVICLSNGTTFVIGFPDSSGNISVKFLPTGNTLSGATTVFKYANTFGNNSGAWYYLRLFAQASGGFALFTVDYTETLFVVFSNATATAFYPATNSNGAVGLAFPTYILNNGASTSYGTKGTVYENGGNIYFGTSDYNGNAINFSMISINETTYSINPNASATSLSPINSNLTASVAPGSLVTSSTTPTKVAYYAGSSTSGVSIQTITSSITPTLIASVASDSIATTTLSDGRFAIGYFSLTSPYPVIVKVYSSTGSLLQTLSPGNTYNFSGLNSLKLFALASGKLGVAFVNSTASNLSVYIYNSSYSVTYSVALLATQSAFTTYILDNNYGWDIAGCQLTDRFALVYNDNSSYQQMQIFDNTITSIQQINLSTAGYNGYGLSACANQLGGFLVNYYTSGTSQQNFQGVNPLTANTYTLNQTQAVGTGTPCWSNFKICATGGNRAWAPSGASSNGSYVANNILELGTTNFNQRPQGLINSLPISMSANGANAFGMTGYGTFTMVVSNTVNNATTASFTVLGGSAYNQGNSIYSNPLTTPSTQVQQYSNLSLPTAPRFSITPGPGYSSVIAYRDYNNYPNFIIVNTCPLWATVSITSGVSVGNSVPVVPASSGSTAITNTALVGVANTTASAGGTGTITINGNATLNSNYSAATAAQAFDYQLPNGSGIQGVKGTISGRNVTLFGNN